MSHSFLQQLTITCIALAKEHYSDAEFARLDIQKLQQTLQLAQECIATENLVDVHLLRHITEQLILQNSVEETLMHSFVLFIYVLAAQGSDHPLERGIIKQKINGILPIFETGFNQGLIRADIYDKNADALAAIANNDSDKYDVLAALGEEYQRL